MSLQSLVPSFTVELLIAELPENFWAVLCKILLQAGETAFRALKSFLRLFWGEQPPFTPIGCGGRYFLGTNVAAFFLLLLVILLLLDCV